MLVLKSGIGLQTAIPVTSGGAELINKLVGRIRQFPIYPGGYEDRTGLLHGRKTELPRHTPVLPIQKMQFIIKMNRQNFL
jgi:hypothetical protein